jgi:hypothetical protein
MADRQGHKLFASCVKKRSGDDHERGDTLPPKSFEGQVDLGIRAGSQFFSLQVEGACRLA